MCIRDSFSFVSKFVATIVFMVVASLLMCIAVAIRVGIRVLRRRKQIVQQRDDADDSQEKVARPVSTSSWLTAYSGVLLDGKERATHSLLSQFSAHSA